MNYVKAFFADPKSTYENDNESVPVESGRVGFVAWCALYAVHSHRRPPQGLRFWRSDVQAAAFSAR